MRRCTTATLQRWPSTCTVQHSGGSGAHRGRRTRTHWERPSELCCSAPPSKDCTNRRLVPDVALAALLSRDVHPKLARPRVRPAKRLQPWGAGEAKLIVSGGCCNRPVAE